MLHQERMAKIAQKALKQPKIALRIVRRQKDAPRYAEEAIKTYELCRGGSDEQWAIENLMAIYAGEPVAVE